VPIPQLASKFYPRRLNVDHGGTGTVSGTVSGAQSGPGRFRVRLHSASDGTMVAQAWSDASDGSFSFGNLRGRTNGYFLLAISDFYEPEASAVSQLLTPGGAGSAGVQLTVGAALQADPPTLGLGAPALPASVLMPARAGYRDWLWGGRHEISSTVVKLGKGPGRYRVRLIERRGGNVIRETFSDRVTGAYSFPFIKHMVDGYMTMAVDGNAADRVNAAIADFLTPDPMP
jgi:hypothetical protein